MGVAATDPLAAAKVYPGLEILAVDGIPVGDHFVRHVLRTHTRGSTHANEALLPFFLLYGPEDEPVTLTVGDPDGTERVVTLTRRSAAADGVPFMPGFLANMMSPALVPQRLDGGVLYVRIPTFENPALADQFLDLIDGLDPVPPGMILDVRGNVGGSSATGNAMVGALLDETVFSPSMTYPQYAPAREAWGHEFRWITERIEVPPRDGARYRGPLVILTDAITHSTAEDFVIELRTGGRARVVGQRTAGGAGHGLVSPLPGGGTFTVSTFRVTCPDGTEYVGTGGEPDLEVAPTRDDVLAGRDPVLERAIELVARR